MPPQKTGGIIAMVTLVPSNNYTKWCSAVCFPFSTFTVPTSFLVVNTYIYHSCLRGSSLHLTCVLTLATKLQTLSVAALIRSGETCDLQSLTCFNSFWVQTPFLLCTQWIPTFFLLSVLCSISNKQQAECGWAWMKKTPGMFQRFFLVTPRTCLE